MELSQIDRSPIVNGVLGRRDRSRQHSLPQTHTSSAQSLSNITCSTLLITKQTPPRRENAHTLASPLRRRFALRCHAVFL